MVQPIQSQQYIQLIDLLVWLTFDILGLYEVITCVEIPSIFKLEYFIYLLSTCKDILENRKGAIE